jgi:hypothetical protein
MDEGPEGILEKEELMHETAKKGLIRCNVSPCRNFGPG